MLTHPPAPKWGRLYAAAAVMFALLALEAQARLGPREHELVEIGIVLAAYGAVWLWLNANRLLGAVEDPRRGRGGGAAVKEE